MGRLLLLIALVGLSAYLIKKIYLEKPDDNKADSTLMKKCHVCQMHMPSDKVFAHEAKYFCSEAHRDDFLNS